MVEKILVVEDSQTFLKHLTQQLISSGFIVDSATSFAEAKDKLDSGNNYLCAILDYCLPDAPSGEVIDLAIENRVRSVVLSATFKDEIRDRFIQKGVLDYILKDSPAWSHDLLSILRRLINNRNHHALVVDDSQLVRNYLSQLLEHQYIRTSVAQDGIEALTILEDQKDISFIITDHDMPEMNGLTFIRKIREKKDRNVLPILGLSGNEERTLTAQFIKAGANDFLYKPFNQEELYCRIHYLLGMKEANDKLYKLANQDELTSLWNRRYFFKFAQRKEKEGKPFAISMLDIDFFKKVNDSYGHDCGDKVIQTVASILKIHFESSCVARLGGEEFCVLYEGDFSKFLSVLDIMRNRISSIEVPYLDNKISVTISIGATNQTGPLDEKIKIADAHLYTAKQQGRNRIVSDK
ncbi:diguanylate cyclase [Vibrio sp.]|uniref:diguanylate cyclase n=1 Tax=Vibrio viridaestus TaxID=2487322 RepID=A0A3N9U713_9VIBR|nr:response regulator [Vibrio viridaestus]MDC0609920.1 diguanylate cyclase [Vibrio sp.]RQW63916.1 response regulator [Vibrio viridaestus]